MTNALILGMLFMLMNSNGVEHPKVFIALWLFAIVVNSFADEKWR